MPRIQVGDSIPTTQLFYLPPSTPDACVNAPIKLTLSDFECPLLIVVVPGAFTPTCSERHIPGFLTSKAVRSLKESGIKNIFVLSTDGPFITRAWGEKLSAIDEDAEKARLDGYIKFVSDAGAEWLTQAGLSKETGDVFIRDGLRGIRSAIVVGEGGKVEYIGVDAERGVVAESGIDGVLNGWKSGSSKF